MSADSAFIYPVILSGGSGTRLWPLSRAAYPKQLLALSGQQTLLQDTAHRAAALPGAQAMLVVASAEHGLLVREQLAQAGCVPTGIFLEPQGRNTAPAIALAALHLARVDPEAVMLVMPCDHVVEDQAAFEQAVSTALPAARAGWLCMFGIAPARPETGYGYMRAGLALAGLEGVVRVSCFIEKPDLLTATRLLQVSGHFWNSGIFVFTAKAFLQELERLQPDLLTAVTLAWQGRQEESGFLRLESQVFSVCPAISIDHAVMQGTRHAAMVEARFGWSDIGSWDGLWRAQPKDTAGNSVTGDVMLESTTNSLIHAGHRLVSVVGMDNVAVIETADAVLVINKNKTQDMRQMVAQLQAANRAELHAPVRVYRSWGWYEVTDKGDRFKVKRLMVAPGKSLSLQMHLHRAEHWVVVSGTAKVTIGGLISMLTENQSAYVPLGQKHRLQNQSIWPLHIVEVQSGDYLEEDDIVRYDS